MSLSKIVCSTIILCTLGAAPGFSQTTVNGNLTVQITITAACQINSAGPLNFGSNGVLSTDVDVNTTIVVQCTSGVPFNLGLGPGAGTGATLANRLMTGPSSATIGYSLYTTAGRTTVWGNTSATNWQPGTGTGAPQNFTVYGRVPPQTTPAAGTYSDTVAVTLTY
jgi:spore coat protein U-like protein